MCHEVVFARDVRRDVTKHIGKLIRNRLTSAVRSLIRPGHPLVYCREILLPYCTDNAILQDPWSVVESGRLVGGGGEIGGWGLMEFICVSFA